MANWGAILLATIFLAEKLCEPVGGILTHPVNYTGDYVGTSGNATTTMGGSPAVFTGAGRKMGVGGGVWGVGLGIVVGVLLVV